MMIQYTIGRYYSPTSNAIAFHKVTRRDAAANRLWAEIYAMLYDNALCDRPVAWRMLREFESADISPPRRGYYRRQVFRLESTGDYVEFYAERVTG